MSELTGQKVLIVGELNSKIQSLQDLFLAHGMEIIKSDSSNFHPSLIEEKGIDVIILNALDDSEESKSVLSLLKNDILSRKVPVFAMVQDIPEKIQDAITLGATDYIVAHEENHNIMQKIKAVFTTDAHLSGTSVIDITPTQPSITTKGIRVYLIEDDPLLKNLLSIRLNNSSFPFEFNSDGQIVVEKMHKFKPDIVILDVMLPGVSGFEILQQIKNDPELAKLPVIIFSNRDGQEDRKKASDFGADAFYVKAMTDLSELITKIESLVNKK